MLSVFRGRMRSFSYKTDARTYDDVAKTTGKAHVLSVSPLKRRGGVQREVARIKGSAIPTTSPRSDGLANTK